MCIHYDQLYSWRNRRKFPESIRPIWGLYLGHNATTMCGTLDSTNTHHTNLIFTSAIHSTPPPHPSPHTYYPSPHFYSPLYRVSCPPLSVLASCPHLSSHSRFSPLSTHPEICLPLTLSSSSLSLTRIHISFFPPWEVSDRWQTYILISRQGPDIYFHRYEKRELLSAFDSFPAFYLFCFIDPGEITSWEICSSVAISNWRIYSLTYNLYIKM